MATPPMPEPAPVDDYSMPAVDPQLASERLESWDEPASLPNAPWPPQAPQASDQWASWTQEANLEPPPPMEGPAWQALPASDPSRALDETALGSPWSGSPAPVVGGQPTDDFWHHAAPGFDDESPVVSHPKSMPQPTVQPVNHPGAFLDQVLDTYYPTETPPQSALPPQPPMALPQPAPEEPAMMAPSTWETAAPEIPEVPMAASPAPAAYPEPMPDLNAGPLVAPTAWTTPASRDLWEPPAASMPSAAPEPQPQDSMLAATPLPPLDDWFQSQPADVGMTPMAPAASPAAPEMMAHSWLSEPQPEPAAEASAAPFPQPIPAAPFDAVFSQTAAAAVAASAPLMAPAPQPAAVSPELLAPPQPQPAPVAHAEDPDTWRLDDLRVQEALSLTPEKALFLVGVQDLYALMGLGTGEVSVIRTFDRNPLSIHPVFQASMEGTVQGHEMYLVQVGPWKGIVSGDAHGLRLQTELATF